jgi:FkbM family methyltransferase
METHLAEPCLNQSAGRKPFRLAVAQTICRNLPPLVGPRLRTWIYPYVNALRDNYPFVVASHAGIRFQGTTSDPHAYSFSVNGYYDWRNLAIAAAVCHEGDTIIEVGANVGTETVGFARVVGNKGRVIAFEPSPSNVASLEGTLALNSALRITLFPAAVGNVCAKLQFCEPARRENSGLGHIAATVNEEHSDRIEVDCLTLDSLADQLGRARLIAIDVEGFEVPVLRGAQSYISDNRPVIVLEATRSHQERAGYSLRELHDTLTGLDYEVRAVGRLRLTPADFSETASGANWICVHRKERNAFQRIASTMRIAAFLPGITRLNPILRVAPVCS